MDHFTIFQDFYRVIAEMTEEEIVSAIIQSNPAANQKCLLAAYPEQVFPKFQLHLRGTRRESSQRKENRTTGNHLFSQLPGRTFKRNSRQVSGIHRGRHRPSDTGSIGTHPRTGKKVCPHPHRFHQPQRNGTENRGTCMPDRRDIARNNSGN